MKKDAWRKVLKRNIRRNEREIWNKSIKFAVEVNFVTIT